MMGRKEQPKGSAEHPITCRICRRMTGRKFKTKLPKQKLNRRTRRKDWGKIN